MPWRIFTCRRNRPERIRTECALTFPQFFQLRDEWLQAAGEVAVVISELLTIAIEHDDRSDLLKPRISAAAPGASSNERRRASAAFSVFAASSNLSRNKPMIGDVLTVALNKTVRQLSKLA